MRTLVTGMALTAVLALPFAVQAETKPREQKLEPKPETVTRAQYVDFGSELGVDLKSLTSLGQQIDQARRDADPVALATAARVLAAAEKASGKTAKIDAASVAKEAIELARLRQTPAEMRVVAGLVGGADSETLRKEADEIQEKIEAGEETKDLHGSLAVDNHTCHTVDVYADGHYVGHVHPHSQRTFHVHAHHCVEARDHHGHKWYVHVDSGHYHCYRLCLHLHHH